MSTLDLDTIIPVAEKSDRDSESMSRWGWLLAPLAYLFAAAIVLIPVEATVAVMHHYSAKNYEQYMQETHLVNFTITSVTPDGKSEMLIPNAGEGTTTITLPNKRYDTVGQGATAQVLSDGRYVEDPSTTLGDYIGVSIFVALLTALIALLVRAIIVL